MKEASENPIFQRLINQASGTDLADVHLFTQSNVTDTQNRTAQLQPTLNKSNASFINIENELKPALIASYENHTSAPASVASAKCLNLIGCPAWADEDWYISNEYWIFCENKGTNLCRNILVSCMYINS